MLKVNENRDDALRRIGEVAAAFSAHESPAAFVEEAVGKLVEIFFTPKHRGGFSYDVAAEGSDRDVPGAPSL